MWIRDERPGDCIAIADVTARAFAGEKHSDQSEPDIITRLRAAGDLSVSLVAFEDDALVAHVAFSPVTIDGERGRWFGLGPVSVAPDYQASGIGTALIREGLDRLRSGGAAGCVVLGDPAYYRRFGFGHDEGLRYDDAPPEYFMFLPLNDDEPPRGRVGYAPGFRA